jgi:hypothetical protein
MVTSPAGAISGGRAKSDDDTAGIDINNREPSCRAVVVRAT